VRALGFYNHGEWKAMCPEYGCTDAVAVHPQSPHPPYARSAEPALQQVCARGHVMDIELPDERRRARIEAALAGRAMDADRSWYPKGHEWAIMNGFPTGQSIEDLTEESHEVERVRADDRRQYQEELRAALAAAGIEVRADGSFEGTVS
jgi:hypothetical protein